MARTEKVGYGNGQDNSNFICAIQTGAVLCNIDHDQSTIT